jgi:flagellin-specific chaperone FliS
MRARLALSLLGFLFGSSILVISLFSATQVSSTGGTAASESKLYFSQEILPDHSFYKVMMAMDRLQLETASPQEQIFMRVEYANRRLDYAKALLEKDKEDLAFTTLLKSQQYLHQAVQNALAADVPNSVKERVSKAVAYHTQELRQMAPGLTDANRAQLDRIVKEHDIYVASLKSQIAKN